MNELNSLSSDNSSSSVSQQESDQVTSDTGLKTVAKGTGQGRRILVVEDDESLSGFLTDELRSQGFFAEHVVDGDAAFRALSQKPGFDLLILDLNLPKLDGMSVLRNVRPTYSKLPILVLTARSRVEEKVHALESGADDYLTKPFSLAELLARVNVLLRRNAAQVPNCLTIGDLTLWRDEHRVERNGRRIELTPREFDILEVLMRNAGRPVSRATLLEEVWKMDPQSATNIVDVYVKYVRDKIDLPGETRLTHTIRGFGYELRVA
jgi:two-component system, OmpR family, copper resistance phosphate regulon response regulator CusR